MSELFSLKDFHVVKFSWYSSVGVIKGEWKGKDEVKKNNNNLQDSRDWG